MKKLKTFEGFFKKKEKEIEKSPEIGDFVRISSQPASDVYDMYSNEIGEIIDMKDNDYTDYPIPFVERHPHTFKVRFIINGIEYEEPVFDNEIVEFSKNKEDLAYVEDSKKYNL